jgi:thiol:disulfide interchange protein
MKRLTFTLLFALLLTITSVFAQSNSKVVVIVNKADWCSICKAYGGRTVATFTEHNKDNYFQLIVNDVTNSDTKKASKPAIEKVGLVKTHAGTKASGLLTFYDTKTKQVLAQVTVANTEEEIAATMKMVRDMAGK